MLFITDKVQLHSKQVVVVKETYPQSRVTNTGENTANLLISKDGLSWDNLATINPNQEVVIFLDKAFPYITFKEDTTLYIQSETPNHYNKESSSDTSHELKEQLNNLNNIKADKTLVEDNFNKLINILLDSHEHSKNLLQDINTKVAYSVDGINTLTHGNNLLLNTLLPSASNPICHRTVSKHYIRGINVAYANEVITLSQTASGNRYAFCDWSTNRLDLEPNTSYVFSGYIKANVPTTLYTRWTEYSNRKWSANILEYQATTEWSKFEFLIHVPDKEITGAFLDLIQTIPRGIEVSFKYLKLEKGITATPYSPAFEDMKVILPYLTEKVHKLGSTIQADNSGSYTFGD